MDSLKDKVAFVTGATAGIGLACVKELASRGAKVTVASRNKEHVDATVDKLLKEGYDVRGAILDASDIPSCTNAVVDTIRAMGRIDIVVNNAGGTNLSRDTAVENLDLDFFRDASLRFSVTAPVITIPGATALHLIPSLPYWVATYLVRFIIPALAMP